MQKSTTSSHIIQSFNRSIDIQQLKADNTRLNQQVKQLFHHLNQLLIINQQLNICLQQRIQQTIKQNQTQRNNHNNHNQHNNQHINQQQIQTLAYQVVQLQMQLQQQKSKNITINKQNTQNDQYLQQTILVITQLTNSFQTMQSQYQQQISRLQQQLTNKQKEFQSIISTTESKYSKLISQYNQIIINNKQKDTQITQLQQQLRATLKTSIHNGKQQIRKEIISNGNIDIVKERYQQQINQKNRIIKLYEEAMEKLKIKIKQQDK